MQKPYLAPSVDGRIRGCHPEPAPTEQRLQVSVGLRAGDLGAAIGHGAAPDEVDRGREEAPAESGSG